MDCVQDADPFFPHGALFWVIMQRIVDVSSGISANYWRHGG